MGPPGFRGTTINMPCDLFVPITMQGLLSPGRVALGLGRVLRSVLYEMNSLPPAVIAAAVAGLAAVALAAGFVPARRASRVDPIEALRHK